MARLYFFDPEPPGVVRTRGIAFDLTVEVAGAPDGLVVVTLGIDGVAQPTEAAFCVGGLGYVVFPGISLARQPISSLSLSATGITAAAMDCTVEDP